MAFRDNIAPTRETPISDRITKEVSKPAKDSTQELTQSQASKFRTVSTAPNPAQNVGSLVKVQANTKGTGIVGRPSGFGESVHDTNFPAKENPSGARNQTTTKYRG